MGSVPTAADLPRLDRRVGHGPRDLRSGSGLPALAVWLQAGGRAQQERRRWTFDESLAGAAEPMDRHLFDKWLTVAERVAGLPKLVGGLWHPYRRKWATERKAHPIKDVAAAGGWKDVETLLTCYQQPDDDTLMDVMAEPRKLRESAT